MIELQTDFIPGLTPEAPADSTLVNAANEIAELKTLSFDDLVERLAQSAVNFAINLAIAIVVFYVGRFIIRKIYRLISTIFLRRKIDKSLATFVLSLVNIVLYFILIVTVIGILGIETTSFLAIFASAGVAVGMALSGTLQNFAGGVLILLLKPYKIGDYIEVQGYAGTVREIQIFHTIITTYDNKSISIPNGGLSTGSVNNWSREAYRRVTWTVSISYGDNVDDARKAILDMFAADERIEERATASDAGLEVVGEGDASRGARHTDVGDTIAVQAGDSDDSDAEEAEAQTTKKRTLLDRILHRHHAAKAALHERERKQEEALKLLIPKPDHSPKVVVNNLGESSVDLQVRAWTKTGEYWNVFYYYNEKFYNELPGHGIHFPFPQMDVHLDR
ncbi:MAG: mechanosensitive ion channel [Muribaculaceae bacterium]|nr:mechanosensitive ion channel [Muribaculaceae bacterium]